VKNIVASDLAQQEPEPIPVATLEVPPVVSVPVVIVVDIPEDIPGIEQGVGGTSGFRTGSVGSGLRPPAPSSVEPSGTPTRPTEATEPIVGDEADAEGLPSELPAVAGHVPDAVPAMPAPSKIVVDRVGPAAFETPEPKDVPDMEDPTPDVAPVAEPP
jgi:hypothetical protein